MVVVALTVMILVLVSIVALGSLVNNKEKR